jgi:hypothetical protein
VGLTTFALVPSLFFFVKPLPAARPTEIELALSALHMHAATVAVNPSFAFGALFCASLIQFFLLLALGLFIEALLVLIACLLGVVGLNIATTAEVLVANCAHNPNFLVSLVNKTIAFTVRCNAWYETLSVALQKSVNLIVVESPKILFRKQLF